jgi:hypothetical protein
MRVFLVAVRRKIIYGFCAKSVLFDCLPIKVDDAAFAI